MVTCIRMRAAGKVISDWKLKNFLRKSLGFASNIGYETSLILSHNNAIHSLAVHSLIHLPNCY